MKTDWLPGLRSPAALACLALLTATGMSRAGDADANVELRSLIEKQSRLLEQQSRELQDLKKRLEAVETPTAADTKADAAKKDDGPADAAGIKKIVADYLKKQDEDKKKKDDEAKKKAEDEGFKVGSVLGGTVRWADDVNG